MYWNVFSIHQYTRSWHVLATRSTKSTRSSEHPQCESWIVKPVEALKVARPAAHAFGRVQDWDFLALVRLRIHGSMDACLRHEILSRLGSACCGGWNSADASKLDWYSVTDNAFISPGNNTYVANGKNWWESKSYMKSWISNAHQPECAKFPKGYCRCHRIQ